MAAPADTGTAPVAPAPASDPPAPADATATTTAAPAPTTTTTTAPAKARVASKSTAAKPAVHAAATKPAASASSTVSSTHAAPATALAVPPPALNPAPVDPAVDSMTPVTDPSLAAPATEAVAAPASPIDNSSAEYAIGGALAALAVGGAALLAARRRRPVAHVVPATHERDHVSHHRPDIDRAPSSADRSAFAWGAAPAVSAAASTPSLSPIEQAKRGPTPDNPSLSLKKRLKRAAFFENRERAVAAGQARPVSRLAGLPQRAVEAMKATTRPVARPAFQPA